MLEMKQNGTKACTSNQKANCYLQFWCQIFILSSKRKDSAQMLWMYVKLECLYSNVQAEKSLSLNFSAWGRSLLVLQLSADHTDSCRPERLKAVAILRKNKDQKNSLPGLRALSQVCKNGCSKVKIPVLTWWASRAFYPCICPAKPIEIQEYCGMIFRGQCHTNSFKHWPQD